MGEHSQAAASLKSLSLIHEGITSLRHLRDLPSLVSLTSLNLHMNRLTALEGLSSMTNLEALDVSGNELTQLHEHSFHGLHRLRRLNLSCNRLSVLHPKCFQPLQSIQQMSFAYNRLTGSTLVAAMRNIPSTAILQSVNAAGNEIEKAESILLALKTHSSHLRSLQVRVVAAAVTPSSSTGLGDGDVGVIAVRENPFIKSTARQSYSAMFTTAFPSLTHLDGERVAVDPLRKALRQQHQEEEETIKTVQRSSTLRQLELSNDQHLSIYSSGSNSRPPPPLLPSFSFSGVATPRSALRRAEPSTKRKVDASSSFVRDTDEDGPTTAPPSSSSKSQSRSSGGRSHPGPRKPPLARRGAGSSLPSSPRHHRPRVAVSVATQTAVEGWTTEIAHEEEEDSSDERRGLTVHHLSDRSTSPIGQRGEGIAVGPPTPRGGDWLSAQQITSPAAREEEVNALKAEVERLRNEAEGQYRRVELLVSQLSDQTNTLTATIAEHQQHRAEEHAAHRLEVEQAHAKISALQAEVERRGEEVQILKRAMTERVRRAEQLTATEVQRLQERQVAWSRKEASLTAAVTRWEQQAKELQAKLAESQRGSRMKDADHRRFEQLTQDLFSLEREETEIRVLLERRLHSTVVEEALRLSRCVAESAGSEARDMHHHFRKQQQQWEFTSQHWQQVAAMREQQLHTMQAAHQAERERLEKELAECQVAASCAVFTVPTCSVAVQAVEEVDEEAQSAQQLVEETQLVLHHENERLLSYVRELESRLQSSIPIAEHELATRSAAQEREALNREVRNLQGSIQSKDDAFTSLEEEALTKLDEKRRRIAELEDRVDALTAQSELSAKSFQDRLLLKEEEAAREKDERSQLVESIKACAALVDVSTSTTPHVMLEKVTSALRSQSAVHHQVRSYESNESRLLQALQLARDELVSVMNERHQLQSATSEAARQLRTKEEVIVDLRRELQELKRLGKRKQVATLEALTQMVRADLESDE